MRVLGIETSSPVTSVALWQDGEPRGRAESQGARGHVEFLMPAIMDLVEQDLGRVDAIAVGLGPGLFTGMRVGIATAKILASSLATPLAGVGSLDALTAPRRAEAPVVVACVNAFRGEVFAARYEGGARIDGPRAVPPDVLAASLPPDALLVGDGPATYPDALGRFRARAAFPDAGDVVALALPRLVRGDHDDARTLEPLYVRRSDAEIRWEEHGVVIERPFRVKIAEERREG